MTALYSKAGHDIYFHMHMRIPFVFLVISLLLPLDPGMPPGSGEPGLGRQPSAFMVCATAQAAESGRAVVRKKRKKPAAKGKEISLHGQPWAFGSSDASKEALWQDGVGGETLQHRATGGRKGKAIGNTSSIEASLQREAAERKKREEKKKRGGVGLSLDTDESVWRHETPTNMGRPDETLSIGSSRHTLRAFGGVESDDLSISVGPEITVKDRDNQGHFARSDEPDSAVGMGMRFSLDF